ncbi:tRNA dihydrouridine synthase [Pseudothermotoga thermarum]|nr:tRNA-dihydrouridine synthase [Pseudothermotoga thermarum]
MAGITSRPFRKICSLWGAEFSYTEMISAESVLRAFKVVQKMLPDEEEKNVAVQLFGNDPNRMAQAAKVVEPFACWININAACPAKKVLKKGSGGALLKDLERLKAIISAVKNAVQRPVTVKVRIGFEENELEKIMQVCIDAGADGVEVHGRTVEQGYGGKAIWDLKLDQYEVATVISGDIYEPQDVEKALSISGAQAVLIARGALRKPWIFAQLKGKNPTVEEIKNMFLLHLKMLIDLEGPRSFYKLRQFVAGYTHGMPGARMFRERFMLANSPEEQQQLINEFFNQLLMNNQENEVVKPIEELSKEV